MGFAALYPSYAGHRSLPSAVGWVERSETHLSAYDRYTIGCSVHALSPGRGGWQKIGTAFCVRTFGSIPIAARNERNNAPCDTTSTAGGCAVARLTAATARRRSAANVSAPSGVDRPLIQ